MIENLDVLKGRFGALMAKDVLPYLALSGGPVDDKAVERVIDFFVDPEGRKEFLDLYHEVETLYEILSPDPFLRPYIEDYGRLSQLFQIVQNAFRKHGTPIYDVAAKTEKLVRELADTTGVSYALAPVPLDEETLEALRKEPPDPNRVINLGRSIACGIFEVEDPQAHLFPIGDRAEKILDAFEDRQITTQDAIGDLEKLLAELLEARRQLKESGLERRAFAVFWILQQEGVGEARRLAIELDKLFEQFPNHEANVQEKRALKAKIYKFLLPAVGKDRMVALADRIVSVGGR